MIDAKTAYQNSKDFYKEITLDVLGFMSASLEEIELRGEYWWVTLGFQKSGPFPLSKEYKVFKVHSGSGRVESMTLRK